MGATKLDQFGGMLPAWDDRLIPAGQAALSQDAYLFSGALVGWRKPKLLRSLLNSSALMTYRVPTNVQATAFCYMAFVAQPNEGDLIKLGEEIYKFTATVTNPYDVFIAASSTLTAAGLLKAFLANGTAGVDYGSGTVINPVLDTHVGINNTQTHNFGAGAIPIVYVQASDFGAAFNTTPVTTSAPARVVWLKDLALLADVTTVFTGGLNQTFDSGIAGAATWLEFVDPDTNVVRTPVVNDKFLRYYFVSPSLPPQYNTTARIQGGQPPWLLGVPPPGCALGVTVQGGGDLALLGYPTSNTINTVDQPAQSLYVVQITPLGAMQLNDVAFIPMSDSTTANIVGVLYSDAGGIPGTLLNVGLQVTGVTTGIACVSQFVNATGLLANVPVWIGFMTDTEIVVQQANNSSEAGSQLITTFSNGPPLILPTSPAIMQPLRPTMQIWGDLTTSSVLEARSYLYTWVTEYEEEGPPSPPTVVNGWSNAVWTLTFFSPPTDDMGVVRNIKKLRLYRTISSQSGNTTYFWVCDVDIASNLVVQSNNIQHTGDGTGDVVTTDIGKIVDTMDDSVIALNTQLISTLFFPPPEGLQGIKSMPNGMAVGFRGNELWFSEPYFPHAWPPNYVITTEFPIVGVGVSGQSAVACTSSTPYVATGVNPANMTLAKTNVAEPCHSRGSIVDTDAGVYYASPNGLVLVTQAAQVTNTTEMWITREKWRLNTPQKNVRAVMLASSYFAFGTVNGDDNSVAQQGFTIELAADNQSFTIWPQPGGHRLGFNRLSAPNGFDLRNVLIDPWTGTGLVIQNGAVYYYDFTDTAPTLMAFTWRSKKFQQTSKKNFSVVKVYFSVPPNTPAQNGTRSELATLDPSWVAPLASDRYGILRVYADDILVTTREIRNSGEILRVLSGFKADVWQFEISARVNISNFQVATSVKELGSV